MEPDPLDISDLLGAEAAHYVAVREAWMSHGPIAYWSGMSDEARWKADPHRFREGVLDRACETFGLVRYLGTIGYYDGAF